MEEVSGDVSSASPAPGVLCLRSRPRASQSLCQTLLSACGFWCPRFILPGKAGALWKAPPCPRPALEDSIYSGMRTETVHSVHRVLCPELCQAQWLCIGAAAPVCDTVARAEEASPRKQNDFHARSMEAELPSFFPRCRDRQGSALNKFKSPDQPLPTPECLCAEDPCDKSGF